jgi:hypothetical protein
MCNESTFLAHLGLRLQVIALLNLYNKHLMLPVHQFDLMILSLIFPPWTVFLRAVLKQGIQGVACSTTFLFPFLALFSPPSVTISYKSLQDAQIMESVSP